MNDLVSLSFAILLPLLPAYLLYKTLPARASVKGPLKGLNIQLSGAFAGYFLVVLLTMGYISTRSERIASRYDVWEVTGKINPDQGWGGIDPSKIQLRLLPSSSTVLSDGRFDIQIAPEVLAKGRLKFPTLSIDHPDFESISINLNESEVRFGQKVKKLLTDAVAKQIVVNDIELKKKPQAMPYAPSGPPPQQIVSSTTEVQQ